MNDEANLVQLWPSLAALAVSISMVGPADGAWGRQLLARQQELQMAAQFHTQLATVGARTNEEKSPRALLIFLEVIAELPQCGRSSKSEKRQTQHLCFLRQSEDEGGVARVKSALCKNPGWSPPWISESDRERRKNNTLNLTRFDNYSTKPFLLICQTKTVVGMRLGLAGGGASNTLSTSCCANCVSDLFSRYLLKEVTQASELQILIRPEQKNNTM